MKVPVSWLKEYVDIPLPLEELAERLTLAGLEVEAIERIGDWWDRERIVVGEVVEVLPHPNADRLVLVDVAYQPGAPAAGRTLERCVTGAPNLFPFKGAGPVSLKVAFAMEGAELYDGHQEGQVKMRLKGTRIRGVPSRAMVCSEKELGISDEHEGILFLPQDAPVGLPLQDYLGDAVLDISLTPNLARCMSMLGVAREVAALTGSSLRYPDTSWLAEGRPAHTLAGVEIHDPDLCARYIATVIQDVQIAPSPRWLQDRVHRGGMRPISNIVDITNCVMLEWGQPLHAFDYDKLVARAGGKPTIIVRRARPGETMTTLDGVARVFDDDTLLICDTVGPIAVAGVMGGLETEIEDTTRSILLESASFDMISIRRTTQALKLPSEASQRFGRGIHPALPEPAARRASELMRRLAGGTLAQGMVDAYPRPAEPVVIELVPHEVERSLGVGLAVDEIERILRSLEFEVEGVPPRIRGMEVSTTDGAGPQALRVTVPEHRVDCRYPADLIEEVARVYGYDRIPVTELADRLPPQRANRDLEVEEQVRDILVGCGLQELVTYSLTNLGAEAALVPGRTAADLRLADYVALANPISPDRIVMRQGLLSTLLEKAAANLHLRATVALFEIGKVYLPLPDQILPAERLRLAIVLSGPHRERDWQVAADGHLDYFDLKGIVEVLVGRLHLAPVSFEAAEHPTFQPGRTARLFVAGVDCGWLGELHPAVREAFDLPEQRVAVAHLDLEALVAQAPATWRVQPVSTYPAVLQDVALVVDEAVPLARLETLIREAGGPLLRGVQLFDVYHGEPIPAGKKSMAFSLTFQAPDKTLSDGLVAKQVKRIAGRAAKELGAALRGS